MVMQGRTMDVEPWIVLGFRDMQVIVDAPFCKVGGMLLITPRLKRYWCAIKEVDGCLVTIKSMYPDGVNNIVNIDSREAGEFVVPGSIFCMSSFSSENYYYGLGELNSRIAEVMKQHGIIDYELPKVCDY